MARFVDHLLRPRLLFLTRGPFYYAIGAMILLVALVTPVLKIVPLGGILPNAALVALALALIAKDGVLALFAFAFTGGSVFWPAGLF